MCNGRWNWFSGSHAEAAGALYVPGGLISTGDADFPVRLQIFPLACQMSALPRGRSHVQMMLHVCVVTLERFMLLACKRPVLLQLSQDA